MTPVPSACDAVLPECARRFEALEEAVRTIDSLQRIHDRKITQLEVKVALAAGFGAVAGSVITTIIPRLLRL